MVSFSLADRGRLELERALNLRARVYDFGFGPGSGLASFVSEPVGLLNFLMKYRTMSRIYINLCARACSGFQKSPRALE